MEKIWSGQSILSAWEDLYDLTFVRWDKHQEWSPWNCILLTKDEAASHVKLVDLEEVSTEFVVGFKKFANKRKCSGISFHIYMFL